MNQLEILISERDDATILSLSGSADMGEAELLYQRLEKEFSQGRYKMVIDLSNLEFTSSMGLGALIRAHTKCRKGKGQLNLVNPQPAVMKVFKTTHLNELFNIFQTLEEAVESLQGAGKELQGQEGG